ncbi:monocyte chemotactic protein 1B-like [Chanos chanos]|uniref:Monocyte chemotactic protein 1B-like n=1 Tax=Chanos chanos TaxID=29144 RepID=A0A6J2WGA3_CHACN|nr:monocyte chemotactic protein 1B-like [Chanos chanos]
MRNLPALLFLVLLCSLQLISSFPLATEVQHMENCCGKLHSFLIPLEKVKSYSWTSRSCPRRAIVFTMIKGRTICVRPDTAWVSSHIAKLDSRKTRTGSYYL